MHYIFLDLEMNNTWTNIAESRIKGFNNEIIEIGAIKLNEDFNIIETFQTFVRPYAFDRLSPKIQKMTKIKNDYLWDKDKSLWLGQAIKKFNIEFLCSSENYIMFTWGSDDKRVLIDNCEVNRVDKKHVNWIYDSINLQERFSDIYYHVFKRSQVGLKDAMAYYKIGVTDGRRHRAVNDSIYVSKVFQTAFKRLGIKNLIKLIESNEFYYRTKFKKDYYKLNKIRKMDEFKNNAVKHII